VATLEERVAYLEGKVEEQSRGVGELRDVAFHVDQKVDRVREEIMSAHAATNARIDALDHKVDRFREELGARIDAVDQKVDRFREELASRIEALDQRLTGRMEVLDQKVSKQFIWLVGLQVTVLLAVLGALLGRPG